MKIASWNVAGVRARLTVLPKWLEENDFDIICLQETKVQDKDFPYEFFENYGYQVSVFGQKSFNGVAILSKKVPDEIETYSFCNTNEPQARFLKAIFSHEKGALHIASLYVPNGNPTDSAKYPYKLNWIKKFHDFAKKQLELEEMTIFAGDYNIIPQPIDAKNPKDWENDAAFTEEIRKAFYKLIALGYQDAIRLLTDEPSYSFWDFQKQAFTKDNGIRIDHFLLSPQASDLLKNAYVQKDIRSWNKSSDHAPIILEIGTEF